MTPDQEHTPLSHQFASDNYSGLCPEAMEYFIMANQGHDRPYGDDSWTTKACSAFRDLFGKDCQVYFVTTGTAANALALAAMCQSYHSIICHEHAHIENDECGAPQFYTHGARLLLGQGPQGKLERGAITSIVNVRNDIHYPKPQTVSITQATETGMVYSLEEISALSREASQHGLTLHMDGARFANAVASLNCTPADMTWKAGVDALSLGGTKNGMAFAEAVVFFNLELAREFDYRCKQAGHLVSKLRFAAAQWYGMITTGAWLTHAQHANRMAMLLEQEISKIEGVSLLFPRQANALFVSMPDAMASRMRDRGWYFYDFIAQGGYRLICSWDTTEADINRFIEELTP